jgi:hypothetical protein
LASTVENFRDNHFFTKWEVRDNFVSLFDCFVALTFASTVCVKVSLKPLDELQVILVLGFDELFNLKIRKSLTSMCLLIPIF